MFHKVKDEKERQQVFDSYMLSILKEREVIKKNKKAVFQSNANQKKMECFLLLTQKLQ